MIILAASTTIKAALAGIREHEAFSIDTMTEVVREKLADKLYCVITHGATVLIRTGSKQPFYCVTLREELTIDAPLVTREREMWSAREMIRDGQADDLPSVDGWRPSREPYFGDPIGTAHNDVAIAQAMRLQQDARAIERAGRVPNTGWHGAKALNDMMVINRESAETDISVMIRELRRLQSAGFTKLQIKSLRDVAFYTRK